MNYRECFPFIVEDDGNFATLLCRAFQKAGVPSENIRWFPDGERARSAFGLLPALRPTFVTLDMELPDMSGLSLLRWMRSSGALEELPVYVLSGRGDQDLVRSAYALRARGYWLKPAGLSQLQSVVSFILSTSSRAEAGLPQDCLPDPSVR